MKKIKSIIILAFIATINAAYLTYNAYLLKENTSNIFPWLENTPNFACDINKTFSCSSVFTYDFAWILGIPFSLIALIVYPVILVVAYLGLKKKISKTYFIIWILSILGLIFNWYIIYNESIVGVYCFLCLVCTFIISVIWIISILWIKNLKK